MIINRTQKKMVKLQFTTLIINDCEYFVYEIQIAKISKLYEDGCMSGFVFRSF